MSQSIAESTYSDTDDRLMLGAGNGLHQWDRFETDVFAALDADRHIERGILLNAGAGRRVTEAEAPFFSSFAKRYFVEPDDERRSALIENTLDNNTTILPHRIENLAAPAAEPAAFVLCKYVLQHMHTETLAVAVERLKSLTSENGVIGIFSSVSMGDSYYFLQVPAEACHLIPKDLRGDHGDKGRITEAQFNRLINEPQIFPFIATHHIGMQTLLEHFAGWAPTFEIGPAEVAFLRMRRPPTTAPEPTAMRLHRRIWLTISTNLALIKSRFLS